MGEQFEKLYISIHSLRMEGDGNPKGILYNANISIHSLRMEGDCIDAMRETQGVISIHSLRMEGDLILTNVPIGCILFQSTPSAWRETCRQHLLYWYRHHFNPLPPHGGRLEASVAASKSEEFQSTPSAWRETAGKL